jgi:hypothetical protein
MQVMLASASESARLQEQLTLLNRMRLLPQSDTADDDRAWQDALAHELAWRQQEEKQAPTAV